MIINDSNLSQIRKVTAAVFGTEFERLVAKSVHPEFTLVIPMGTSKMDMGWLGSVPELQAWPAAKDAKDVSAYSYEITPTPFESTIKVHKHKLEDANGTPAEIARLIGLDHLARQMAVKAALWYPRQCTAALTAGSDAGSLAYDNKPMFDGSHPNGVGGTYSNEDTSADVDPYYLIDSRGVKPIIFGERERPNIRPHTSGDIFFLEGQYLIGAEARGVAKYGEPRTAFRSTKTLSLGNLRAHIKTMSDYTDDYGTELGVDPDILMVGKSLRFTAQDILEQAVLASGETNMGRGMLRLVYNPFMA